MDDGESLSPGRAILGEPPWALDDAEEERRRRATMAATVAAASSRRTGASSVRKNENMTAKAPNLPLMRTAVLVLGRPKTTQARGLGGTMRVICLPKTKNGEDYELT